MADDEQLNPRIYAGVARRRSVFEPVDWWAERAAEKQRQAAEQADD